MHYGNAITVFGNKSCEVQHVQVMRQLQRTTTHMSRREQRSSGGDSGRASPMAGRRRWPGGGPGRKTDQSFSGGPTRTGRRIMWQRRIPAPRRDSARPAVMRVAQRGCVCVVCSVLTEIYIHSIFVFTQRN